MEGADKHLVGGMGQRRETSLRNPGRVWGFVSFELGVGAKEAF